MSFNRVRWTRRRATALTISGAVVGTTLAVFGIVAFIAVHKTDRAGVILTRPPLDVPAQPTATPSSTASAALPTASPAQSASASANPGRSGTSSAAGGPVRWPNAGNTGVPTGKALKKTGDVRVIRNGALVDGLDVRGMIIVEANNVTIKNTRLTNADTSVWGIVQQTRFSGLVVQDSEIRGNGSQQMQQGILNLGGGLTVRRTDISQVADGVATNQGLIEDCYLHDPKAFDGDHVDMIQATSGPDDGKSLVIRHNTVINDLDQTSALALFQDFGVAHDVLVVNNYLAGGGYTVYGGEGDKGTSRNIRFEHNTFGRDVYANGGKWGPVAHFDSNGPGNTWIGNVWAGTGAAVTA
ncbi:hypothetical protein HC028_14995 [Planosporangium flavigriseum]|uniref:Right handed beta helix region n=1 Tax=Planosporangium flavigriseum TaxID=373681 RepID=A0A8J3PLB7_9ACTN|nr:hypothetical protein [Planosporangium flavigriseum]NJC65798.1 hypothetical protein [Planosporangium flavigriseum]GIG73652.1 hypothetical protein Pfl04_20560 [Planosporangium flavigriseum]